MSFFYVYVLLLKDGKFYVGFTSNLRNRIQLHKKSKVESTRPRLPLERRRTAKVYGAYYSIQSA
ncbi:MAG: hypothetical protein COZ85_03720 [Candidatus Moranbacteria bacterium CG_4_8_14_3_um_filter_34_16]|nr:MAG: hypothetical protein COT31_02340 [Candidatus Moranbacteria bacterium CG08_land_8_20_14_0_20_34_16]PIW94706.1 MAG: hypothetical protein COZ85_03720 [Candidatus Moranbacteria bacterium CG_4_8_14_3_um_filter_34_16]